LVLPDLAVRAFGALFAAWAVWKFIDAMTPRMCGDPGPLQLLAILMSGAEFVLGIGVAAGRLDTRALMSVVGVGAMLGLVGFAFVAEARGLPTRHCFCFGGIELPWKGHAAVAAALALPWLAILLDTERRLALAKPAEVAGTPAAERPSGP
jgi:hypothetical protein